MTTATDIRDETFPRVPSQRTDSVEAPSRRPGWQRNYAATLVVSDLLCGIVGGALAVTAAHTLHTAPLTDHRSRLVLLLAIPAWLLAVAASGGYESRVLGVGSDEFKRIVNAGVRCGAGLAFLSYLAK